MPLTALLGCAILASGCLIGERKVTIPKDRTATVLLLSHTLDAPLEKLARHPWFAVRDAGQSGWESWEIGFYQAPMGYVRRRPGHAIDWRPNVRLHGVLRGEQATRFIRCLRAKSPRYEHRHVYRPWPGPNSNTYVDVMLRRCRFRADLPPTAIGKDYRGIAGVSWTSSGTGVQIETAILGLRVGLKEGIQIHLWGFTFGVDFWPPAIIHPVGEGRIGFADR